MQVSVSVGGFVSGRRGCGASRRNWRWIEAHNLQFTLTDTTVQEFICGDIARALIRIATSDAQGRSGGISLTPKDVSWLEDAGHALHRICVLAPDPGNRLRGDRCSDRFPWGRAHAVNTTDARLATLLGGAGQSAPTIKVTILPKS